MTNDKWASKRGGWDSQLVQQIRKIGFNKDVSVEFATVKTPPPALVIELDRDGIPIDMQDNLTIAEHLTEHTRLMSFSVPVTTGGTANASKHTVTIHGALQSGDRVFVLIDGNNYFVIDKAVE